MKCGECGRYAKGWHKGWRVRGPKGSPKWVRCPTCVARWKIERLREQELDDDYLRASQESDMP